MRITGHSDTPPNLVERTISHSDTSPSLVGSAISHSDASTSLVDVATSLSDTSLISMPVRVCYYNRNESTSVAVDDVRA